MLRPKPFVSIVIAAHETRPDHLLAALTSAAVQTWSSLEILIGDDSRNDTLATLVESLGDARIRYEHHASPKGVALNHWDLFRRARGDFIVVLNHDDLLVPNFVETLIGPLQSHPEFALAFCDHWIIDDSGRQQVQASDRNTERWGRNCLGEGMQPSVPTLIVGQCIPFAMGTMFRRDALPADLPLDAGPAYDLWLSYLLTRTGGAVWYVPQRLSAWRSHSANITTSASLDWLRGAATCWEAVATDPVFTAVASTARDRAALAHYACAMRCWGGRRHAEARLHARRCLMHSRTWRGGAAWLVSWLPSVLAPLRWRHGARSMS